MAHVCVVKCRSGHGNSVSSRQSSVCGLAGALVTGPRIMMLVTNRCWLQMTQRQAAAANTCIGIYQAHEEVHSLAMTDNTINTASRVHSLADTAPAPRGTTHALAQPHTQAVVQLRHGMRTRLFTMQHMPPPAPPIRLHSGPCSGMYATPPPHHWPCSHACTSHGTSRLHLTWHRPDRAAAQRHSLGKARHGLALPYPSLPLQPRPPGHSQPGRGTPPLAHRSFIKQHQITAAPAPPPSCCPPAP